MAAAPIHPKDNNFGGLRLFFSCLVIFSHSPFVLTGSRAFEPHFGPMTFGSLAVDGFFLISGYLITKSFVGSPSVANYFKKRFLRIYPGFVVNGVLCMFVLSPLVGADVFHLRVALEAVLRLLVLQIHNFAGIFPGMPVQAINGSAWTIPYEFRCYILVAMLGLAGTYGRLRLGLLLAALALMVVSARNNLPDVSGTLYVTLGSPIATARLTGVFMFGMAFYLYRDRIPYNTRIAVTAAAVVAVSAFVPAITELVIATFGGYVIFWFALRVRPLRISIWANETDLSYGIYLYAWPVQMTIAYFDRSITSWTLSILALVISAVLAYFSWTLVEKPALSLAHRRGGRSVAVAAALPLDGAEVDKETDAARLRA